MTDPRRAGRWAMAGALIATLTTGCSGQASPTPAPSTPPTVSTPQQNVTTLEPTGGLSVPPQPAALPSGTYRTHITRDDIIAEAADDLSNAGTWTLIVTQGQYRLECRPVADPGQDCGNSVTTTTLMELGDLRGTGTQAWFAADMGRKAAEVGCARGSAVGNACGPESPYRLTWALVPDGIAFSDFVGLGDTAGQGQHYINYTLNPWSKIG